MIKTGALSRSTCYKRFPGLAGGIAPLVLGVLLISSIFGFLEAPLLLEVNIRGKKIYNNLTTLAETSLLFNYLFNNLI